MMPIRKPTTLEGNTVKYPTALTDLNTQGPSGIFTPTKITQIVQVLTEIRGRAAA